MLQGGKWGDRQVVPASWVRDSTRPCPQNPGYGYLWWLLNDPAGFATGGYRDTNCYIFPGLDLVVARIQNTPAEAAAGAGTVPYEPSALPLFRRMIRAPVIPRAASRPTRRCSRPARSSPRPHPIRWGRGASAPVLGARLIRDPAARKPDHPSVARESWSSRGGALVRLLWRRSIFASPPSAARSSAPKSMSRLPDAPAPRWVRPDSIACMQKSCCGPKSPLPPLERFSRRSTNRMPQLCNFLNAPILVESDFSIQTLR